MNMLNIIIIYLFMIINVSFYTIFERKILSLMNLREGPLKNSYMGVFQFMNDGIKLMMKEWINLMEMNFFVYFFSSLFSLFMSLYLWLLFPFMYMNMIMIFSLINLMLIFSLKIFFLLLMGWSVNSNYSIISFIRLISQIISYEMVMMLNLVIFLFFLNDFSLLKLYYFQKYMYIVFFSFMNFFMWLIIILSEVGRLPFDFFEGESELVSGFSIEFNSLLIMYIFFFEYLDYIYMGMFTISLYFNLNYLYIMIILYLFIWIRGFNIRERYDFLMMLMWKKIMPLLINMLFMYMLIKLFYLFICV